MSEAIRTSGSPSPSYSTSVHEADGSAVTSGSVGTPSASELPVPSPAFPPSSPPQPTAAIANVAARSASAASIVVRFTTESLLLAD